MEAVNLEQAAHISAVISAVGVVLLLAGAIVGYVTWRSGGVASPAERGLLYRLARRIVNEPVVVTAAVSSLGVLLVQWGVLVEFDPAWADRITGLIVMVATFVVRYQVTPARKVQAAGFKYDKGEDTWRRKR